RHRGRRLPFPDVPGIRPSPDRVRETLFNWLAPVIVGARCLDLFAGSGALGLEALSRGAESVVFVDRERRAVQAIREHLAVLGVEGSEAVERDVRAWLTGPGEPFDIVFADPPYAGDLLPAVTEALEAGGWLAPGAQIYLEARAGRPPGPLPAGWQLARSKKAGQVGYHLAVRDESQSRV
ncbi:MAG: 16S rRNA (guanine(966)-N(2))-methyltransferase RsmD, partial [Gammaproteobacteria bacterium]